MPISSVLMKSRIFVLKHTEGLDGIAAVLDGHSEIGWHHTVMVGDIFFDLLLEETCVPLVFNSQFNIFPAFGNVLFAIQDSDMMSKT